MVLSSLSALIAQSQETEEQQHVQEEAPNTRPAKRQRVSTSEGDGRRKEDPSSQKSRKNSKRQGRKSPIKTEDEDRKPAAKRKRGLQKNRERADEEENGDKDKDDDSLYRDDEKNLKQDHDFDTHDPDDSFHDYYAKAFEALYGPTNVPVAASVSPGPAEPPGAPTDEYLQSLQQIFTPEVPAPLQYTAPHERIKPRLVRWRNPKTKRWEMVQETPEQARKRFYSGMRRDELGRITSRWRNRTLDLRDEVDVGGAIYERAKRQLQEKLRREEEEAHKAKQQKEAKEDHLQAEDQVQQQLHEDDDSVQEQQDVLDRLTQQSADYKEGDEEDDEFTHASGASGKSASSAFTSVNDTIAQLTADDVTVSYRERLDYWAYGYAAPKEVDFDLADIDLTPRLKEGEELEDPDEEKKGAPRLPLKFLLPSAPQDKKDDHWEPSYFPPCPRGHLRPLFYQYRLVQSLATRHLCGGGSLGEHPDLENLYLRLLFSPVVHGKQLPLAKYAPSYTYLRLSHILGRNALLYAKNIWSDPVAVAKQLWLFQESPIASNSVMAGRIQNPETFIESLMYQRAQVVNKYKVKSRPWVHKTKPINSAVVVETDENRCQMAADQVSSLAGEIHAGVNKGYADDESSYNGRPKTDDEIKNGDDVRSKVGSRSSNLGTENEQAETTNDETVGSGAVFGSKVAAGDSIEKAGSTENEEHQHSKDKGEASTDGTSGRGVAIELQTKESIAAKAPTDNVDWQLSAQEAVLSPTSTFSHIPGTSPPVPQFPLDPTALVYGPIDRHAKYDHQENHVHHGMFKLALSTMLSRVARGNSTQKSKVAQQIQSLFDKYVDISETKTYRRKFLYSRGGIKDVPLVQFYCAILSYCSYLANGCPILAPNGKTTVKQELKNPIDEKIDDTDDDLYIGGETDFVDPVRVASHLFAFLEERIQHNGLARFPRLRVTYALSTIARKLPAGAAQIMTRPLDDKKCPTPIHIMRQTCEYLEEHSYIRGAQDLGYGDIDESMRAGEWEYLFFEVAKIFQECVEAGPTVPEYHAWYVGTLAVCFLLGSGNQIGSSAWRYPSAKSQTMYGQLVGESEYLEHEVREKLPKYEEVGSQLSSAIRVLFALARHQSGATAHLMIVSILEWKQVIALLVGESLNVNVEKVSLLHRHHSYQRFLSEKSDTARASISESSKTADFWASELECDPGNIEHWRALVNALGYFGKTRPVGSDLSEHKNACLHCSLLCQSRIFDHKSQDGDTMWWGHGREWWLSSLLQLHEQEHRRNQSMMDAVMQKLEESSVDLFEFESENASAPTIEEQSYNAMTAWLPTRQQFRLRQSLDPLIEERKATYDALLPPGIEQTTSRSAKEVQPFDLAGKFPEKFEVFCYKVFIVCHLIGPGHHAVGKSLYPLIRSSWDAEKECVKVDCNEFQFLQWLFKCGIDIPKLSRLQFPKKSKKAKTDKN